MVNLITGWSLSPTAQYICFTRTENSCTRLVIQSTKNNLSPIRISKCKKKFFFHRSSLFSFLFYSFKDFVKSLLWWPKAVRIKRTEGREEEKQKNAKKRDLKEQKNRRMMAEVDGDCYLNFISVIFCLKLHSTVAICLIGFLKKWEE